MIVCVGCVQYRMASARPPGAVSWPGATDADRWRGEEALSRAAVATELRYEATSRAVWERWRARCESIVALPIELPYAKDART